VGEYQEHSHSDKVTLEGVYPRKIPAIQLGWGPIAVFDERGPLVAPTPHRPASSGFLFLSWRVTC